MRFTSRIAARVPAHDARSTGLYNLFLHHCSSYSLAQRNTSVTCSISLQELLDDERVHPTLTSRSLMDVSVRCLASPTAMEPFLCLCVTLHIVPPFLHHALFPDSAKRSEVRLARSEMGAWPPAKWWPIRTSTSVICEDCAIERRKLRRRGRQFVDAWGGMLATTMIMPIVDFPMLHRPCSMGIYLH